MGCQWAARGIPVGGQWSVGRPGAPRGLHVGYLKYLQGLFTEIPRAAGGLLSFFPWASHGGCFGAARGLSVDCLWAFHRLLMACPWAFRRLPIVHPWAARGRPVGGPWDVFRLPVGCSWAARELPVVFPAAMHGHHGLSMGILREARALSSFRPRASHGGCFPAVRSHGMPM